jgi:TetR/AcrR family transcriptional repressor of bet genes
VPRQVDHQERRRHIGDAVLRLIAARGLEAASLRNVAAEAGVSMGTVQHYFADKQAMLDFAQHHNYERATERIPKLIAEIPEPRTFRTMLRVLLVDLLCLEGESREGARLGAAMLARAAIDPQAAATARTGYDGLSRFMAAQLRTAQQDGEIPAGTDPEHAARYLNAVVEGLRWPTLIGACTPDQALAVLDDHLGRLFTPATHGSGALAHTEEKT